MSGRNILIGCLIFATLVIPIVQLSFGFNNISKNSLCPLQPDIMLLMAIGGVFEVIFFGAAFGFVCAVTPSKYKAKKVKTSAETNTKGDNRASLILIGKLSQLSIKMTSIFCF